MSGHTRPGLAVAQGPSRKRKEREVAVSPVPPAAAKAEPAPAAAAAAPNRLLAGYLAHEFLTCGTLLGRRWAPARAEASSEPAREAGPDRAYAEVSRLLRVDGTHIPGVVNPTQLGRWLRM